MQRTLLALAALTSVATAQLTTVLPYGMTNAAGSTSNAFPWGTNASTFPGLKILACYDSSNFTAASISYPILIQGLRWRANDSTASWTGGTYAQGTVSLSTAAVDQSAVTSTSFAANHGPDLAVCYSGPVTVQPGTGNGVGVPGPWHVGVTFNTPFLYDPSAGDLAIDTDFPGGTNFTGGTLTSMDIDGTATALSSRVFGSTLYPNANGITLNHGIVVEVTYVPAQGLYAGFSADVTGGASPLAVNFTDRSFSSDPAGVQGWAWDFDGDSVVDSTLQNPSFVYQNCGSYNVSLTVVDASHSPSTLTRTAYINTDAISANFTSQVIGPLAVAFTDTSSMPATSWAWDLDGDSIIDSTAQNPAWVYPNANPVNVTLTVTRLCAAPSTITKTLVPLQQISHNVAPNNGLSTGASVYFDLNVTNPSGIRIGSLDVAPSVANTAFTVEVFVKQGTYTGFTGTASEWVSAGVGTSAGGPSIATASAPVSFAQPLYLPPGLHGIKLWYIGVGPRYQTGSAVTTVTNGDLSLTVGTSRGSSTTNAWAGSDITPRLWSGVLYYDTHNVTGNAGFGTFGPGCAGTLGTPSITANANPTLGSTLSLTVNNLPNSNMVMCTGFSNTTSLFGPLPYDVTPFGAPGCFLRASTEAVLFVAGANNQAVWNFAIPNNPAYSGIIYYNQAIAGDAAANAFGATVSNATSMLIGN